MKHQLKIQYGKSDERTKFLFFWPHYKTINFLFFSHSKTSYFSDLIQFRAVFHNCLIYCIFVLVLLALDRSCSSTQLFCSPCGEASHAETMIVMAMWTNSRSPPGLVILLSIIFTISTIILLGVNLALFNLQLACDDLRRRRQWQWLQYWRLNDA